ncbi:MAG TPA: YbaK/EbsC family protein [Actinomycetes bacterium]|jgi:prolyl-tRNA editing enzyme YbaK/EbsC (Cys-tRNA(Pro) deacylase)|nr:YbaK/EbsC family protein [Actinomycetes bacterium]
MDELPRQARNVLEAARGLGLELDVREFPDGTRTARDAARAVGCAVEQIVKSLVFMADGRPVLVLTSGGNLVDPDKVARELGATHVRKADADQARAATGYAIGGTPPFGHPRPIQMLIDQDLTRLDTLWAAAGTPRHVFPIASGDLLRASDGRVCDVAQERATAATPRGRVTDSAIIGGARSPT